MIDKLTEEQWRQYESQGYLRLGKVLSDGELTTLQQRMDDIFCAVWQGRLTAIEV